jgi:hypothetical protein
MSIADFRKKLIEKFRRRREWAVYGLSEPVPGFDLIRHKKSA